MRPVKIVMCTAAVVLAVASLQGQTPPDFSGRWVVAPDPPPGQPGRGQVGAASMGSGWGADITVAQDAKTLTIQYAQFARSDMQPPMKFVYLLDGSASRNTINMGRGPQEQVSRAAWDGSRLVITTTHSFKVTPDGPTTTSETRQALSLESPTSLVIETTRGAVLGGQPSTTKTVYRRN